LLNGIWYEVEFKDFPIVKTWVGETVNHHRVWDMVISCSWMNSKHKYTGSYRSDCKNFHGRDVYAANKRQLNKKEIRQLKLWEKL
jgi:S-adenosylmethionine hydrolase